MVCYYINIYTQWIYRKNKNLIEMYVNLKLK